MSKTTEAESSAHETIVSLLAQAFTEAAKSKLNEDMARKWAEALMTLHDRQVQGAESVEVLSLRATVQAVRKLHKKFGPDGGGAYCGMCSNHGDITWPCATIRALDGEK